MECPLRKMWVSLITLDSVSTGILLSYSSYALGAFISRKCFSRLQISCMAKAKHPSLEWIDINPDSIEVAGRKTLEDCVLSLWRYKIRQLLAAQMTPG